MVGCELYVCESYVSSLRLLGQVVVSYEVQLLVGQVIGWLGQVIGWLVGKLLVRLDTQ